MTFAPSTLVLHISSVCNARCRNCRWRRMRTEGRLPSAFLPAQDVRELLLRCRPQTISLTGTGEPLLSPEFDAVVDAVEAHAGLYHTPEVMLVTNGALLGAAPRSSVAKLLRLPGHLEVSLDAANSVTHAELRPGTSFERVVEILRTVVRLPRHPRRRVGLITNVSTKNSGGHTYGLVGIAQAIGLDFVMVTRTIQLDLAGVPVTEELASNDSGVRVQIDRARDAFPEVEVIDFFTSTGTRADVTQDHCQVPWTTLQVFEDGHAHLCCRAYDVDLGDWRALSFESNPVLLRLRQQLVARAVDPDEFASCSRCPLR